MIIYSGDKCRVLKHPLLQHYYVQCWMEGDDSRSYGRKWDYFTVLETSSIDEVKSKIRDIQTSSERLDH